MAAVSVKRKKRGVSFITGIILLSVFGANGDACGSVTAGCSGGLTNGSRTPIYVGGMLSMSGWDGTGCLVAAELALEQINERADILPDYELEMVWNDTQCSGSGGTRALFHQIFNEPQKLVILGPPCAPSALVVASAASYYNLITVLSSALAPSFSDRTKYHNVFRTVPMAVHTFNDPLIWLMKTYDWRRVAHLADSTDAISEIQSDFVQRARFTENITIFAELIDQRAQNQIDNFKRQDVRLVFGYFYEHTARIVMCTAYKSGFYGPEILWVMPNWYEPGWWLVGADELECTPEELVEMIESSIILGTDVSLISPLARETVAGITPQEFVEEIKRRFLWPKYDGFILNNYVGYIYDAFWAVALMLNRTDSILRGRGGLANKRLEDFTYTDNGLYGLFLRGLALTDFFGVTGRVFFTEGERLGNADITQIKGHCPNEWHLYNRHCFLMQDSMTTDWYTAQIMCRNEGAELADLSANGELQFLSQLRSSKHEEWYVGLRLRIDTSTIVSDAQNTSSNLTTTSPGRARDCVFIDFREDAVTSNRVKTGDCEGRRPYICKSKAEFKNVLLAVYDSTTDEAVWMEDIYWPEGKVISDGSEEHSSDMNELIELLIPVYLHLPVISLAVAGFILIVVVVMANLAVFSKRMTGSLQGLDVFILLGGLLMYASMLLTKSELLNTISDQQNILVCQVHSILASVGFTLGSSTLVSRIWLVYVSATINHVESKSRGKFMIIGLFLLIDSVSIVLLNGLFPMTVRTISLGTEVNPEDTNDVVDYYAKVCTRKSIVLPILIAMTHKAVLLLIGAFLSFEVEQETHAVGEETKRLSVTIYNIMMFSVCGMALSLLLNESPVNLFVFSSAIAFCCTTLSVLIIYVPKILSLIKDPIGSRDQTSTPQTVVGSMMMNGQMHEQLLEENSRLKKTYERLSQLRSTLPARGTTSNF